MGLYSDAVAAERAAKIERDNADHAAGIESLRHQLSDMTADRDMWARAFKNGGTETMQKQLASMQSKYLVERGMRRLASGEAESLRQRLANAQAEIERKMSAGQFVIDQLANSQKQVVMLRDVLKKFADIQLLRDALPDDFAFSVLRARGVLATTADLDRFVLCEKEPFKWLYRHLENGDAWQEVEPRNPFTDTVQDRVNELQGYIDAGYKYELLPLYANPKGLK